MGDYQALAASEAALREELRSVKAQVGPAVCPCLRAGCIRQHQETAFGQYCLIMFQALGGRCSACIGLSEPVHVEGWRTYKLTCMEHW